MNKIDFNILNFDSIESTSTYLKQSYEKLDDLTIAFTSFQSKGHGRNERVWVSPKGESLLFSILFKNKKIIDNFYSLSLLSASVVYSFLSKYVSNVSIKWPNDVYVNDKKICGILLEGVSFNNGIEAIVLGIGININIKDFPLELSYKATSLYKECQRVFNIDNLKIELLSHLQNLVHQILNDDKSYLSIVRENNYLKDKKVSVLINGKEEIAIAKDINDDNTLKVIKDDQEFDISVGEIICLI